MIDLNMIDPHVHCRDGRNEKYKETIEHVFKIANSQGIKKIFDMPNTDPPIISAKEVRERLALVPRSQKGNYFLYIGVTANPEQLKGAVRCYETCPKVIGLKMYAGRSVGDLSVCEDENQERVYMVLKDLGYKGVIAVHCERELDFQSILWDPADPISHAWARPKRAEINSVENQIKFSREASFEGILHIVHVSCPESVDLVNEARKELNITCGVTPHHIMWSNDMLKRSDGLIYKTNPPLREKKDRNALRNQLEQGKIDWIETDHAPHSVGEKLLPPYLSGFPSLYLYRYFIERFLPGLGIDEEQIRTLTHGNIMRAFGDKIE